MHLAQRTLPQAELSMSVLGSSIALLSGQKPPFRRARCLGWMADVVWAVPASLTLGAGRRRLLVQAFHTSTQKRATHIEHAVSDAFVVATQRVKQAQKSEIPHMEEHVSKLEFVGVQTQLKLQDIRSAAAAVGVVGLSVLHNCITTGAAGPDSGPRMLDCQLGRSPVAHQPRLPAGADLRCMLPAVGQFRDLVDSCARDVQLQETLRKVLNFTSRGWDAARQHALRAVHTDNRMRIWCADDTMATGLLFRCSLGRVDLHSPVGARPAAGASGLRSHGMDRAAWPGECGLREPPLLPCCGQALHSARSSAVHRTAEAQAAGRLQRHHGGRLLAAAGRSRAAAGAAAAGSGRRGLVAARPPWLGHLAGGQRPVPAPGAFQCMQLGQGLVNGPATHLLS